MEGWRKSLHHQGSTPATWHDHYFEVNTDPGLPTEGTLTFAIYGYAYRRQTHEEGGSTQTQLGVKHTADLFRDGAVKKQSRVPLSLRTAPEKGACQKRPF